MRWPNQIPTKVASLIGTMSDADVARRTRSTQPKVRAWRVALGIPSYRDSTSVLERAEEKYPGLSAKLGSVPDEALGREYGLTKGRVQQIRRAADLPSFEYQKEYKVASLLPTLVPLLATESVAKVSRDYGVGKSILLRLRKENGIVIPPSNSHRERLESIRDLLGKRSDLSISKEYGIPKDAVIRYRHSLGIPPFRLSPRCKDFKPLDRDKIAQLIAEGKTDEEIAPLVGSTSPLTIRGIRCKLGFGAHTKIRWTDPELEAVSNLFRDGKSCEHIAIALRKSKDAVTSKVRSLGLRDIKKVEDDLLLKHAWRLKALRYNPSGSVSYRFWALDAIRTLLDYESSIHRNT